MNYEAQYLQVAERVSWETTRLYSTSFFRSIRYLHVDIQQPICNIYGMVRIADEIVDTFQHGEQIKETFASFLHEVWQSIERHYSTNLILHSFQHTFHEYKIEKHHVEAFLKSMEMDLWKTNYNQQELKEYIYGSAEVVGLMCLRVFCHQQPELYEEQKRYACFLGSFFQKINFLRDMASDYEGRGRIYFDFVDSMEDFNDEKKEAIVVAMKQEMQQAKKGVLKLPSSSRLGVYIAYSYYEQLLKQIEHSSRLELMARRLTVSSRKKITIVILCKLRYFLGFL